MENCIIIKELIIVGSLGEIQIWASWGMDLKLEMIQIKKLNKALEWVTDLKIMQILMKLTT